MKSFFTLFILLGKLYLGIRVLWWIVLETSQPEFHTISEIEGYLVLLVFDVWLGQQNGEIDKSKV
jgi:hypothetical protein